MFPSTEAAGSPAAPSASAATGFTPAVAAMRRLPGLLLARPLGWLRRVQEVRALRALEPRLARDIGAAPARDRPPEGFVVDPRPLWGVGLTPQPSDVLPPWRRREP
jgi:hypothetical protein